MHKRNFWDNLRYLFRRQKNFEYSVPSPSERLVLKFIIDQSGLFYEVKKDNKTLFRRSRLGLKLKDETPLEKNFSLVRLRNKSENETWETAWGEEKEIVNHYNETAFYLAETSGRKRLLTLRFRVFLVGCAFGY
ncbi:glycoside hydrolase family 97 N-terminal domain-containing protein [Candidatus Saccharibacteria bacterium]|nr:glycoside hydrolase family 97 N-terminal domain-containing protein [Candidatus Saccharibacteria bacterium]